MSIFPLPVFEEDADPSNREALTLEEQLEALEAPTTMVVRFGAMLEVGEYKQAWKLLDENKGEHYMR